MVKTLEYFNFLMIYSQIHYNNINSEGGGVIPVHNVSFISLILAVIMNITLGPSRIQLHAPSHLLLTSLDLQPHPSPFTCFEGP